MRVSELPAADRIRFDTHIHGYVGLVGVLVFFIVCTSVQFLRLDLDWTQAPLSFYLLGPGGWVVKAAYLLLSVSLVAIGLGFHRALESTARSVVAPSLFVVSAITLAVTALSDTATRHGDVSLHTRIHLLAAGLTFACVTTAMLLQSVRLHADQRWRPRCAFAFTLALLALIALCIYSQSSWLPKGMMQKGAIVLILAWLGWGSAALAWMPAE